MYLTILVVKDEEEEATTKNSIKRMNYILCTTYVERMNEKNHNKDLRIINWQEKVNAYNIKWYWYH